MSKDPSLLSMASLVVPNVIVDDVKDVLFQYGGQLYNYTIDFFCKK